MAQSSLALQVPKQVLQSISEAQDLASASVVAMNLLNSAGYTPEKGAEAHLDAATAVAMLFSHALRFQLDSTLFVELLSGTVLASDRADTLAGTYSKLVAGEGFQSITYQQRAAQQKLLDGPLKRVTSLRWTVGHMLGNRALDPPERSVPVFHFIFTTADGAEVPITATQEQAQELLVTFKDMVKEAERLSK
eukprot:GILI01049570.1.p1 GENE.GILI01049570.1~~GILI01049570.1.p1  ORF type:complete len:192 (-),score=24.47 GILI01049570.1:63-638(-)